MVKFRKYGFFPCDATVTPCSELAINIRYYLMIFNVFSHKHEKVLIMHMQVLKKQQKNYTFKCPKQ